MALLASGQQMTAAADAGQQPITYHMGRPSPYVNYDLPNVVGPPRPLGAQAYPKQPFGGLRMPVNKLVALLVPPIPNGPPIAIAPHRRGYVASGAGAEPQDRAATAYVAVSGVERAAWYEGL
jgi:hypothetical protein